MARLRPYILGILGLAAITFPFLWLQLQPDFTNNTVTVGWSLAHGFQFFNDLLPVFIVSFLIWLGIRANRHWGWDKIVARNPAVKKTGSFLEHSWAWFAMPIVLCGPFLLSPSDAGILTDAGLFMLLALGLNITVGMTGLLVLGYAAFYAIGAYFFALGQQNLSFFPWWLAAPLAFPLGGIMGYVLGLPCLRLRGDYLAIVTLGFAEAFRESIRNLSDQEGVTTYSSFFQSIINAFKTFSPSLVRHTHEILRELAHIFDTGGDQGIRLSDSSIFRFVGGTASHPFITKGQVGYIVTALVLFLAVFLMQRLYHSPVGRAWIAIRENEIAAASVGIPVVQMKLLAFSLSAAIAAVAGVLFGAKDGFIDPSICEFKISIEVLAMVILGGLGNSYGALLGAALLYLVPEYLERVSLLQDTTMLPPFLRDSLKHLSDYHLLLFGVVMVLMMLYRPQGLLGSSRRKTEMLNK
jgi:branched-chain amino acid transport system permease protein